MDNTYKSYINPCDFSFRYNYFARAVSFINEETLEQSLGTLTIT